MVTEGHLDVWFKYQSPTEDQIPKYTKIREAAREFAQVVVDNTPVSADQTAAIRLLRECVMTANAAIATAELLPTRPVPKEPPEVAGLSFIFDQVANAITVTALVDNRPIQQITFTKAEAEDRGRGCLESLVKDIAVRLEVKDHESIWTMLSKHAALFSGTRP